MRSSCARGVAVGGRSSSPPIWLAWTSVLLLAGCASTKPCESYFIAAEPSREQAAIYKVTAQLKGLGGVRYKLNAGYVPVNVLDALSGKAGEPPDLFAESSASQERAEFMLELERLRQDSLRGMAVAGPAPGATQQALDAQQFWGTLKAIASLTDNEQISIGQTGSTDPYGFRKLAYYVSSEAIQLTEFKEELDNLDRASADVAKAIIDAKRTKADQVKARLAERQKMRTSLIAAIQKKASVQPDPTKWTGLDFLTIFSTAGGMAP